MIKNLASKIIDEVLPSALLSNMKISKKNKQHTKCSRKNETSHKPFISTTVFLRRSSSDITPVSTCSNEQSKTRCCCASFNKNEKVKYEEKDEQYIITLMFFAIQYKNTELLEELCERANMNLNVLNEDGISPLHFAAIVGTAECIKILEKYGACFNMLDERGQKAIHYATMMENCQTVLCLTNGCSRS